MKCKEATDNAATQAKALALVCLLQFSLTKVCTGENSEIEKEQKKVSIV